MTDMLIDALNSGASAYKIFKRVDEFAMENPAFPIGPAVEMIAKEFLAQAAELEKFKSMTYAEMAKWVIQQEVIMKYLVPDMKKINAIKELRALTYFGLKESKQIIEYVQYTEIEDTAPHWFKAEQWTPLLAGTDPNHSWSHSSSF